MQHGRLRRLVSVLASFALIPAILGPVLPGSASALQEDEACPPGDGRRVEVGNATELEAALADARPGDHIELADGTYDGTFVAEQSGTADARIWLCGTREAVIDGGDVEDGYALHLTGDYWTVRGITVTDALKGIMLDGASFNVLEDLAVHTIGHEAVHFRTHSSDNVIQESEIHDTGRKKAKFGEGVYVGSAVSNAERLVRNADTRPAPGRRPSVSHRKLVLRKNGGALTFLAVEP